MSLNSLGILTLRLFMSLVVVLVTLAPQGWSQTLRQPTVLAPSDDSIEARLELLEQDNRRLAEQLELANSKYDEELGQFLRRLDEVDQQSPFASEDDLFGDASNNSTDLPDSLLLDPVPDYMEGHFAPLEAPAGFLDAPDLTSGRWPLEASFGPGFQLSTRDEEFSLKIQYESQIEGRVWEPSRDGPPNSGFFLPRQRFFFSGNMTKQVEYEIAINRGLGNINLLNAYLNFHFNDALEVRVGRFFTPLFYDQYAISNYWLLTPERSLFTTNLSLNRQFGAMAWGYLFGKRLDYSIGAFNGSRNSFESLNNGVDLVAYLNSRPFQQFESLPWLRFLNMGTSVAFGQQDQRPSPATFRIGAGSPDTNIPSNATTPFLILNSDTVERGDRLVGSVHMAYFFNSLSVIGEWQYGSGGYASAANPTSVQVPFSGFHVGAGYFLTGEKVERRTRVQPLRPFLPTDRNQPRGPGAWEVVTRVSQLEVGDRMFSGGFADANLWANSATTTEVGVNWYWNEYMKFYAFWLHGKFDDPVQIRAGEFHDNVDMAWLRCQLYF